MRVIFSRKGFDSSYGGNASPILPDGTLVSIPIPERGSGTRYADIQTPAGSLYDLMRELGISRYLEDKQRHALTPTAEAHLDPDIHAASRPRAKDWSPVFGQCSAAQGHMDSQGVSTGDLILFFGTFRQTQRQRGILRFSEKRVHLIFGYMQIGRIVRVDGSTSLPWCVEHPHLVNRERSNNTLYIAAGKLSGTSMPGAGMLRYAERRVLSKTKGNVSLWRLPSFFHPDECGRSMSRHPKPHSWQRDGDDALLKTNSPGQEYVIEATSEIADWARDIVSRLG